MDSTSILQEADKIVTSDRQDVYGHPFNDFSRIAGMWAAYLGHHITPEDVALMQVMVKVSRLRHSPTHRDRIVDIAGYAKCFDLVREYKARLNPIVSTDGLIKANDRLHPEPFNLKKK